MASQTTKKPAPWQVTRRETPQQTPQQQLSRKRKITEGGSVVAPSEIDEGGPWGSRSNSQSQSQGQTESQAGVSELNKIVKSMTEDVSEDTNRHLSRLPSNNESSSPRTIRTVQTRILPEHSILTTYSEASVTKPTRRSSTPTTTSPSRRLKLQLRTSSTTTSLKRKLSLTPPCFTNRFPFQFLAFA